MSATETEQAKQKVERELVFSILAALTQFPESGTLVIATLRSDFLPDLFAYEGLYDVAKKGLDLRKMTEEDLEAAIKQPLLHLNKQSNTHVIFEPDLIKKLVIDTVSDPAYLPLLQVTLEDLWKRGSLRLAHYYGIAEAFQRHADQVHKNTR